MQVSRVLLKVLFGAVVCQANPDLKPVLPAATTGPGVGQPVFIAGNMRNAASYQVGGVAPGEIVTIFGSRLGPFRPASMYDRDTSHISKSLSGSRILFNNVPAPMVYTSSGQLSAIVPYAVAGNATVRVQAEYNLVKSAAVSVPVVATVPGVFTNNAAHTGAGMILNHDGSLNSPSKPAAVGSTIVMFGTGEGQTAPQGIDGLIATGTSPKPTARVSVTIGGVSAKVKDAGAVPHEVAGVFQIKAEIPAGVSPGKAVPVVVNVGNSSSQKNLTISVR